MLKSGPLCIAMFVSTFINIWAAGTPVFAGGQSLHNAQDAQPDPTPLRIESNLVVVRAQVRDAQGHQLQDVFSDGVDVSMMFDLKPATYKLRVAVIESNQHKLAEFSRIVAVP